MATTKGKISEVIQRIYARFKDKEDINDSLDSREVKYLVEQAMNKILKAQTFERFTDGYVDIPRSNLINYINQEVISDLDNNRAYIELPAIPLSLPMDMGIWQVTNARGAAQTPYIPISSQDWQVMGVQFSGDGRQTGGITTSYLEGQTGYYLEGRRVYFTKDIKTVDSVTHVNVVLLVADLSQLTDNELLPLNPETESMVIEEVFAQLGLGRISQQELLAKHENSNA